MKKTYVSPLLETIEAKAIGALMENSGIYSGENVLGNSAIFAVDKKNEKPGQEEEEEEDENNDLFGGSLMGNIDLWD